MIAAGSLFTSCVTNTEPQGVKDLREAKADYLESLARLRDADAALQNANKAYRDAETALKNAELQLKEITIAVEKAKGDAAIAKAKQDAELAAVKAKEELAKAEAALQKTLRDIAVDSKFLTETEQWAIHEYTGAYDEYIKELAKVRKAEESVYDETLSFEEYLLQQQKDSAEKLAIIEYYTEEINNLPDSGNSHADSLKFADKQQKERLAVEFAKANLEKEWDLYKSENVNPAIKNFASDLVDWTAQNVALPAPFIMNYKVQLPDNRQVFTLLRTYWEERLKEPELYTTKGVAQGIGVLGYDDILANNNVKFIEDVEGKFWLTANFYSAPMARRVLFGNSSEQKSLSALIEALSRDCVVDPATWVDTTGMAAAVKDAEDDYAKTEAALWDGVDAYEDVVEANEALEEAKTALEKAEADEEAAEEKFAEDTASLFASIKNFVYVWNQAAEVGRNDRNHHILGHGDSSAVWDAFKAVMAARKVVFPEEEQYYYYWKTGDRGQAVKDSVEFSEMEFKGLQRNDVRVGRGTEKRSLYGGHSDGDGGVTWNNAYEFEWILTQAFHGEYNSNRYIASHFNSGDNYLDRIDETELFSGTKNYQTLFFNKYFWYIGDEQPYIAYSGAAFPYYTEAVLAAWDATDAAVDAVNEAQDGVNDARFDFYTDVYGRFWGVSPKEMRKNVDFIEKSRATGSKTEISGATIAEAASGAEGIAAEEKTRFIVEDRPVVDDFTPIKFRNPADSLEIVFELSTFTDTTKAAIVEFKFDDGDYFKDSVFYHNFKPIDKKRNSVDDDDVFYNYQLEVVSSILLANERFYSRYADKVDAGKMLIAKVLYKQEMQKAYASVQGTDSVEDALAALEEISTDIADAYSAAIKKQASESEPFFTFVEGLVGKETLAYIFEGLDNALKKAAEYIPAYVEPKIAIRPDFDDAKAAREYIMGKVAMEIVNKVSSGEIDAKGALIQTFDAFMCNEIPVVVEKKQQSSDREKAEQETAEYTEQSVESYDVNAVVEKLVFGESASRYRIDPTPISSAYIKAYIALQVGDAFSGDQFRTLLADVINNYLNALGIDVTSFDGGDIIEKLIFGTVRAMTTEFGLIDKNEEKINELLKALKVDIKASDLKLILVATTTVLNHIYENCDGIISQLDKKYLTEWRTKWAEFDVAMAKYEAQLTAIDNADEAYEDYAKGIKHLYEVRNFFQKEIDDATKAYDKACANLEKLYAGVDWKTQAYESSQDALEAAKLALEAAKYRLDQAEKAYKQVLENHKND